MKKEFIALGTITGFVFGYILLMAWLIMTFDHKQTQDNIALVNPPQQVLEGRVKSVSITTEKDPAKAKEETRSMIVTLCSDEKWNVPPAQIDAVEKWLKSGLAPNKGCD